MTTLVHVPSYTPEPPTFDAPDQSVFEPLVKSYYHPKFWASSSKIDQVMVNFVLQPPPPPAPPPPPVTKSPVELGASRQLKIHFSLSPK